MNSRLRQQTVMTPVRFPLIKLVRKGIIDCAAYQAFHTTSNVAQPLSSREATTDEKVRVVLLNITLDLRMSSLEMAEYDTSCLIQLAIFIPNNNDQW